MEKNQKNWWQGSLAIFLKLSGWIVFPVIAGAVLGKWMDKYYGTQPWLFLACIGGAFAISIFGLIKSALSEFSKIEDEAKGKKDEKK